MARARSGEYRPSYDPEDQRSEGSGPAFVRSGYGVAGPDEIAGQHERFQGAGGGQRYSRRKREEGRWKEKGPRSEVRGPRSENRNGETGRRGNRDNSWPYRLHFWKRQNI